MRLEKIPTPFYINQTHEDGLNFVSIADKEGELLSNVTIKCFERICLILFNFSEHSLKYTARFQ